METTHGTDMPVVQTEPGTAAAIERRVGTGQAEAEPDWYWCPDCKLASAKEGTCPNCGNPYQVTPSWGVPDTAFQPKVAAGRSRLAIAASALAGVLAVAAVIGGVVLVGAHGQSYGNSATSDNQSGGASDSSKSDFTIAALHGTLHLEGGWSTSATIADGVRTVATKVAPGAHVKTEVGALKPGLNLGIVSFPDADPTGVLNQFVTMRPQTNKDSSGDQISVSPSRDLTIAGYTAVAQGFEVHNPQGGLVDRGILYAVNAGDQVVIIRSIEGPAATQDDLTAIEKALLAIN